MNRLWFVLLICALFCQRNTPDADELLPVTSVAVTKAADGYQLLVEGARQSNLEGSAEAIYLEVDAETADALFRAAQDGFAQHLTFMHTSLVLLDPSMQEEDIAPLCAVLLEKQGAPRKTYLARAEESAVELLKHEHPVEEIPGLGLRDLLKVQETQHGDLPTIADGRAQTATDLPVLSLSPTGLILCSEGGAI